MLTEKKLSNDAKNNNAVAFAVSKHAVRLSDNAEDK